MSWDEWDNLDAEDYAYGHLRQLTGEAELDALRCDGSWSEVERLERHFAALDRSDIAAEVIDALGNLEGMSDRRRKASYAYDARRDDYIDIDDPSDDLETIGSLVRLFDWILESSHLVDVDESGELVEAPNLDLTLKRGIVAAAGIAEGLRDVEDVYRDYDDLKTALESVHAIAQAEALRLEAEADALEAPADDIRRITAQGYVKLSEIASRCVSRIKRGRCSHLLKRAWRGREPGSRPPPGRRLAQTHAPSPRHVRPATPAHAPPSFDRWRLKRVPVLE